MDSALCKKTDYFVNCRQIQLKRKITMETLNPNFGLFTCKQSEVLDTFNFLHAG